MAGCCCSTSFRGIVTVFVVVLAVWSEFRVLPQIERCLPCLEPSFFWNYGLEDIPDLTGKVAVVTGANKGLGLATSKMLLQKGATVIMGCRNMKACHAARESLADKVPDLDLAKPLQIDLSRLQSVQNFTNNIMDTFEHIDMLVLNAAVFPTDFYIADDTGLDLAFSVNHVGHFLLTTRLVQKYKDSGAGMKIAVVTSSHHFINYEDPLQRGTLTNASEFDANAAYGFSKLANIHFTQELADRLHHNRSNHIYVNSVHPGRLSPAAESKCTH